ncbi:PLAC8 motif-containing protein [Sesbania bispinosa]|nr:PLAC8 motif-containing protein [Sesbania bispinosa]
MASNPEANQSYGKQLPPKGQWTTGLYDCWDDTAHCFFTCLCPCNTFGQIAEIVDGGTTSENAAGCIYLLLGSPGFAGLYSATYRSKLRRLFSLPEEPFSDSFLHCCCCVCALTQEYRELTNRRIDPSIGWEGNVEKWKREGVEAPIIPTMSR